MPDRKQNKLNENLSIRKTSSKQQSKQILTPASKDKNIECP